MARRVPALLVDCIGAIRILSVPSMSRPFWLRLLSLQPWSGNLSSVLQTVHLYTPDKSIVDFALYPLLVSEGLQTKPQNAISDRGGLVVHDRSMLGAHACR